MVDLDQDRGGDEASLAHRLGEQLRAALMRVVVAIERADQNGGIEDQRDGRGSKTSSLASLLRSPRPELNAPMQVSGGCSPSSFVEDGVSRPLGAPPSSCSSASRTSWGTATPRSRAARCARSKRSASISTVVFGLAAIIDRVASAVVVEARDRRWVGSSRGRLAQAFRWRFRHGFRWPFPIRSGRSGAIRHRFADRGDSILPTSPRPIEVWS